MGRPSLRELIPDINDYLAAFRLMAIPAIAMVVAVTMLRHSGVSMQGSFYVVYLGGIGITGTLIGTLLSVSGICGAAGSLLVGRLAQVVPSALLLVLAVGTTVVMISITPLLGTYVLLLIAMGMRGASTGIAQAMEISNMSRSAGAEVQGKAAALRVSAGRITAFIVPVIMGAVVEVAGLENSFYIMGAIIVAMLVAAGFRLGREPVAGAAGDVQ
jgi:predicted MFS family arabinose efflux permease